jgi:glutaredoxin
MIKVYGRTTPHCAYCAKAKALLEMKGLQYEFYSIPEDLSLDEFRELFPGRKTVPQIIMNGKLLDDGYTSLVEQLDGGYGDDFS